MEYYSLKLKVKEEREAGGGMHQHWFEQGGCAFLSLSIVGVDQFATMLKRIWPLFVQVATKL